VVSVFFDYSLDFGVEPGDRVSEDQSTQKWIVWLLNKSGQRQLNEIVLQLDQSNQGGRSWKVEVAVDVPAAVAAACCFSSR